VVLPDRASLHLTAIEDAEYKEDKIECKFGSTWCIKLVEHVLYWKFQDVLLGYYLLSNRMSI